MALLKEARRANLLRQGLMPKRLIPGCVPEPLPTTPIGPTWEGTIDDDFVGMTTKLKMIVWRYPCAEAGKSQILVTLVPTAGTTHIYGTFGVQQGDRHFNTELVSNTDGSSVSSRVTQAVTGLLDFVGQESESFDDSAALTVQYLPLGSPNVSVDIPASDAGPAPFVANGRIRGHWDIDGMTANGIGFDVSKAANGVMGVYGVWFTSSPVSTSAQYREWYTFADPEVTGDTAEVTLYATTGHVFGAPARVATRAVGSAVIRFESCTLAHLTYTFTEYGKTGEHILRRLTSVPDECNE
ncbi:MAG TPA: hypothetical protein VFN29_01065 [Chiayiivirga sp.]|nr:hypothetical protein [Chiayiivirga sp.]